LFREEFGLRKATLGIIFPRTSVPLAIHMISVVLRLHVSPHQIFSFGLTGGHDKNLGMLAAATRLSPVVLGMPYSAFCIMFTL